MLPLRSYLQLTNVQQEMIVSSTILFAFLSSIGCGSTLNNMYGRRHAIMISSIAFTIGTFLLIIATNFPVFLVGRMIVGIGIGIASLTTPIYIAEVATPNLRGQLVTINAFMV